MSVCCPPDTDTPGFEEEQKSKPEECKIISGSAAPSDPDYVARLVWIQQCSDIVASIG